MLFFLKTENFWGHLSNFIIKKYFSDLVILVWIFFIFIKLISCFSEAVGYFNHNNWDKLINFLGCFIALFPLPGVIWKFVIQNLSDRQTLRS